MKRIAAGFGLLVIVISTSSMNANAEDCPSGHKAHSEQKAAGILDFDKPAFVWRQRNRSMAHSSRRGSLPGQLLPFAFQVPLATPPGPIWQGNRSTMKHCGILAIAKPSDLKA